MQVFYIGARGPVIIMGVVPSYGVNTIKHKKITTEILSVWSSPRSTLQTQRISFYFFMVIQVAALPIYKECQILQTML